MRSRGSVRPQRGWRGSTTVTVWSGENVASTGVVCWLRFTAAPGAGKGNETGRRGDGATGRPDPVKGGLASGLAGIGRLVSLPPPLAVVRPVQHLGQPLDL